MKLIKATIATSVGILIAASSSYADSGTVGYVAAGNQINGCLKVTIFRDDLPQPTATTYIRQNNDPGIVSFAAAVTAASQPGWRLKINEPGNFNDCGGIAAYGVVAVSPQGVATDAITNQ